LFTQYVVMQILPVKVVRDWALRMAASMAHTAILFLGLLGFFDALARVVKSASTRIVKRRGLLSLRWLLLATDVIRSWSHELELFVVVGVVRIWINFSN